MTRATDWHLDQLFQMFPDLSRGTDRMLRCLWRTSGEGRCIRDKAGLHLTASVLLTASPGDSFVLRLTNTWPTPLAEAKRQSIQSELLRGIFEGTVECEDPPWQCQLECTSVNWSPADQGSTVVRAAAALAVQDLVGGGAWEAVGSPGDHVA